MLSYAAGPPRELIEKTIPEMFDETARREADREALISRHQSPRLGYRELAEKTRQTAAGLRGLGVGPGDRVGMWAGSCAEWVFLQVAAARVGAVLVNVNPAYRVDDLGYILERSGMKAIFLHRSDSRADYLRILDAARSARRSALEHAVLLGESSWDEMIARGVEAPDHAGSPDEPVNIQYTSGTTGKPKGVLLTHRNLVNNAWLVGERLRWTNRDRLCLPVPLYHCFGCVMGSLQCLLYGATLVLPAAYFDAEATLRAVDEERCTTLYGVPTMFIAELNRPEFAEYDLSSLRTGIMAGAPCPVELMKRVRGDMHCEEVTVAYGQTESSPVITQSAADDPLEARVGTVGSVLPATEVKIIDAEGRTVPVGEQGELCARGYLVMRGYDGDPEATARAIDAEGWLRTGDLATMRPDGNFRITGRLKEVVIRGGENIYPREVEEFLHSHPKIADAYVFGLPDERLGERLAAWVRLRAGETAAEEEIKEFCRERVARHKIPEFIRFVEEFPMTVTGKVQKFEMRRREIAERGLERVAAAETA